MGSYTYLLHATTGARIDARIRVSGYPCFFFFFSSRRRHTRCLSDWSSDVCSSDLFDELGGKGVSAVLGLLIGGLAAWLYARWKLYQQRQHILAGDARETVVIHHHQIGRASCRERV